MPCCAFAAFILSQIVLGFGTVRRFVLGRSAESEALASNPATEWRLGIATDAAASVRRKPRWTMRTLALASAVELALVLGAVWGVQAHRHHHHHSTGAVVASVSRN